MTSPFRERFQEQGGLRHGGPSPSALPTVKIEPSFDLSRLESFAGPQVDVAGVADKVKPQGGGDLRVDSLDLGKLDEGVRNLQKQRLSQKIQALVDKAQKLIAEDQFRAALKPLDEALKLDRTSAQILFLKAYCFFSLEEYPSALDVLHAAREHADDAEMVILVLMLEAACLRNTAKRVEAQILELMEKGQLDRALALLEGELRRQPDNVALLYHRCGILLLMDRLAQSKRAVVEALTRVGEENAGLFQNLLGQIAVAENQRYLETARLALRKGDVARAVKELQSCRAALAGNDQYEAIRSYAEERSPRGFFGGMFSRDRARPLAEEARQKLLQWLLAEELNAGAAALNTTRFDAAIGSFAAAAKIDSRCRIICFLHGLALFKDLEQALKKKDRTLDLDRCISSLRQAANLVDLAAADPMVAEESQALGTAIADYLSMFEETAPVNELIEDFNSLMTTLEKNPIGSSAELQQAERRFRDLRQRIVSLQKKHKKNEAPDVLRDLLSAVDRNLNQLEKLRDQVQENQKIQQVNACVQTFNQMMEYFQKNPIRDRSDLQSAKELLKGLDAMIAKTRAEQPRGSDGWKVLDRLQGEIARVTQQLP